MRTRTTILAAAALAAGLATSMAQSVYSVNVVGYVNKSLPTTPVFISNPLDNGTNDLNSALAAVPAKSTASFWTGTGFTNSTKSTVWSPNFSCFPGVGFFVTSKTAVTNTFVGQVACAVNGTCTNVLPVTPKAVGSMIPYAGDLNTTNFNLGTIPAKSTASFWTGTGFTNSTKSTVWSPALPINPADGFFITSKTATNWVETFYP